MSRISEEIVQHIAKLARIELSEKEIGKFQKELSSILDYVEQLNKVKTGEIESIKQITGLKDVAREDTRMRSESDTNIGNKLLKQAPKRKDDYYKVPKVLE
jgi:aspartyl/glutamyl-tRNA(Asn/Gln) amidotransferase C subunit